MSMDKKQKTMLVITIIAFGYLGYQIYGLMAGDIDDSPQVAESAHPYSMHTTYRDAKEPNHTTLASTVMPQEQAKAAITLQQAPLEAGQKAYLNMVNQYELAKMRRRLLDEQAAIAAAQHRIAVLNKETREVNGNLKDLKENNNDVSLVSGDHPGQFQLSYVDRQAGHWSATLNKEGRYYPVHIGSKLVGGSTITDINRQGVTLRMGDKQEKITFDGIKIFPEKRSTNIKLSMLNKNPKAIRLAVADSVAQPHQSALYTKGEQRILRLPKDSYTIQVIGSYHQNIVENFATSNDLGDRAMQFYVMSRGKRWYMLLYDNYPTREAAQKALNHLSPNLRSETPWVRAVSGIQNRIRQQHSTISSSKDAPHHSCRAFCYHAA